MKALLTLVAAVSVFSWQLAGAAQNASACNPVGGVQFVCGQDAPEDLVLLPGSQWVVASVFSPKGGGIRLIDVQTRSTIVAYPAARSNERFDAKTYPACPGVPSAEQKASFRTHGLAIRPGGNSVHTLYVVHHGTRESIEVFELDARTRPPVLTWIGCAVAPDPVGLNEVVALPDGGFVATDFLARGIDAAARGRMLAGEANGALWEWQSATGWKMIPGSEASGANGLEISPDGRWFYVAAWGSQSFFRLSRGQTPARRDTVPLGFRADNVRWARDGSLLVAGQGGTAPAQTSNVVKIDPNTLQVREIVRHPNSAEFGAGTVALQVGNEIWVGSFRGDRIARFPVP
jgi:sugar lactone lactonase YvrE